MKPQASYSRSSLDVGRYQAVQAALMRGHLGAALRLLNAGVAHRFSAAYSLEDGHFHNRGFIDKRGAPLPDDFVVVAFQDSFCRFVYQNGFFHTRDSATDGRLIGHKFRGVIASYTAAPVLDSTGKWVIGSVCHFDLEPRTISENQMDLLRRAGRMVSARMLTVLPHVQPRQVANDPLLI
ncbi:hypothetical protein [Xylophilus sp. GOD-11R]|uniref:hypothetical protein n=1 Tax=Xylophilus sp. GOD-11R TaxID=3089814 RepID=UPI00298C87A1|nr:hypothetical protein [Xylophilus sp. GOD-11R]WPB55037.1 hypothetical protein R9X41_12740 [Xylophilus sp. GOD-11R]